MERKSIIPFLFLLFLSLHGQGKVNLEQEKIRFLVACTECNKEVVEEIIETYRSDPESLQALFCTKDEDTETPLHLAVLHESVEIVKMLLRRGASSWVKNKYHCTPLHLAMISGNLDIIHLLVMYDAPCEAVDLDQATPLHWAAAHGHAAAAHYLLKRGVSVNKADRHSKTPLHFALESDLLEVDPLKADSLEAERIELICLFIEYGAPLTEIVKQNEVLYKKIREHFILRGQQVLQGRVYRTLYFDESHKK